MDLYYTCTLATLTPPSPPALREQWVKWSREELAVHKGSKSKVWFGFCFISLIRCFIALFHWIHSLFQSLHVSLHKTFHYAQCISLPEKTLFWFIAGFLNIPKGQWFKAMGLHHSQLISLTSGVVTGSLLHWLTPEHCLCISVQKELQSRRLFSWQPQVAQILQWMYLNHY